jgi:pimeloyl-ACP methyl ester carboxylesterase
MTVAAQALRPPSRTLLLLEGRAVQELGAFMLLRPWLAAAPRGDGHPVLVFPGLLASDFSTQPLRGFLKQQGYAVHGWKQGRNLGLRPGVEPDMLERIEELHDRHGGRKLSLVGWSLGGIYARQLAKLLPDKVRCVISLGSPFAGSPKATVRQNRQHRDGAPEIIGHQHEPSGGMDADKCGPGAPGTNGVERLQLPVRSIDGESTDRAFLVITHPIRLIGGVQAGSGGIQGQAARARPRLVDAGGRHRPGVAIHLKEMDAAAIAGGQVHLGPQHVAKRRAEGSHIGDEWSGRFSRMRLERAITEDGCPREGNGSLQKRASGIVEGSHRPCLTIAPDRLPDP